MLRTPPLFLAFGSTPRKDRKWLWEKNGLDLPLYPESELRKMLLASKAKGAKIVMNSPQWLGAQGDYVAFRKSLEKIVRAKGKKK